MFWESESHNGTVQPKPSCAEQTVRPVPASSASSWRSWSLLRVPAALRAGAPSSPRSATTSLAPLLSASFLLYAL